jgi:mono/diheme cytochrome c family protein
MKRAVYPAAFLALCLSVCDVHAQTAGDPKGGSVLAQQVCSVCHATQIGPDLSPNRRAPTFVELATSPGMTSAALMVALTTPHVGMPMFRLSTEEREDIVAYILSLH